MTSGDNVLRPVEEFIPRSTRETFNQFEKLNEISSVAPFLKRPQTELTKPIIIGPMASFEVPKTIE